MAEIPSLEKIAKALNSNQKLPKKQQIKNLIYPKKGKEYFIQTNVPEKEDNLITSAQVFENNEQNEQNENQEIIEEDEEIHPHYVAPSRNRGGRISKNQYQPKSVPLSQSALGRGQQKIRGRVPGSYFPRGYSKEAHLSQEDIENINTFLKGYLDDFQEKIDTNQSQITDQLNLLCQQELAKAEKKKEKKKKTVQKEEETESENDGIILEEVEEVKEKKKPQKRRKIVEEEQEEQAQARQLLTEHLIPDPFRPGIWRWVLN